MDLTCLQRSLSLCWTLLGVVGNYHFRVSLRSFVLFKHVCYMSPSNLEGDRYNTLLSLSSVGLGGDRSFSTVSTVCLVLGGTYSAWRPTAIVDAPVALSALWTKYCSTRCPLLLVLVVVIPVPCYRGLSLTALLTVKDTGHLISACQCCSVGHSRGGVGGLFLFQDKVCSQGWLPPRLTGYIS